MFKNILTRKLMIEVVPEVFCKKGVLKNFARFTGKDLCQNNLIKKETLAQVFSCEFFKKY